jgi:hypothetical protein
MDVLKNLLFLPMLILPACGGNPTAPDLPATIRECETYRVEICGTWQRQGDHYAATWPDGATAVMMVQRFSATEIVVGRADYGKNLDFVATYSGTISGRAASGQVTFVEGGVPRTGTFTAEW